MVAIASLVVLETLVRIGMLLVMTPNGSMIELSEFFESDYAFYMQLAASIFGFLLALSVLMRSDFRDCRPAPASG